MSLNKDCILDNWGKRLKLFRWLILCFFLIIILRLFHLQVVKGEFYAIRAENNRLEIESIPAPRGVIYDRKGRILATNRPCFCLLLYPQKLPHKKHILESYASFLAPILKKSPSEIMSMLKKSLVYPLRPIYLKKDLTWEEVTTLESSHYFFSALKIHVIPLRFYPHRSLACHLLGYVSLISAEEIKSMPEAEPIDFIGKIGIEKLLQSTLAGKKGKRFLEVDALGHIRRVLKETSPISGNSIYLTLDVKLQAYAEQLLKGKIGVIVALSPKTGEVLTLASNPGFDPNLFVNGMDKKTWQKLKDNPQNPLQNRATTGVYPPGSILKIVTALAALENKVISAHTKINCPGKFLFGNRVFRCWKKGGHGVLDIKRAIIQSCDVFFYQLGVWLGIEKLADYAKQCGFGQYSGIGIEEVSGHVPASPNKWPKGEALNMAIGQGSFLATPLQIAQFFAALANGGNIYRPRIVLKIVGPKGKIVEETKPKINSKLPISTYNLKLIKEALAGVINDPRGTGYNARSHRVVIAGKTGTAQVISLPQKKLSKLPVSHRDHAWFAGFAPVKTPQIAVVVLIEHGGHGGATAAPIATKLIEAYLNENS